MVILRALQQLKIEYTGNSETRTRRLNKNEKAKIEQALTKEKQVKQGGIPMLDIFNFACESALKLSEK